MISNYISQVYKCWVHHPIDRQPLKTACFWNSRYICLPCIRHSTLKRLWIQKLVKKTTSFVFTQDTLQKGSDSWACWPAIQTAGISGSQSEAGTPVRRICLGCRSHTLRPGPAVSNGWKMLQPRHESQEPPFTTHSGTLLRSGYWKSVQTRKINHPKQHTFLKCSGASQLHVFINCGEQPRWGARTLQNAFHISVAMQLGKRFPSSPAFSGKTTLFYKSRATPGEGSNGRSLSWGNELELLRIDGYVVVSMWTYQIQLWITLQGKKRSHIPPFTGSSKNHHVQKCWLLWDMGQFPGG